MTAAEAKGPRLHYGHRGRGQSVNPAGVSQRISACAERFAWYREVDDDGVPSNVADLQNSVRHLRSELEARTSERDDARASLAKTKTLLQALKRSYGLAAASVIPEVPIGEPLDVLAQLDSLQGEAQTAFYRANKEAILVAQSARQYGERMTN